jgi:hypothetical protein
MGGIGTRRLQPGVRLLLKATALLCLTAPARQVQRPRWLWAQQLLTWPSKIKLMVRGIRGRETGRGIQFGCNRNSVFLLPKLCVLPTPGSAQVPLVKTEFIP